MSSSTVTSVVATIPGAKVTELKQLLSHDANKGKTVLLVEGIDDQTFYLRFVDESKVVFSVLKSCYYMHDILSCCKADALLANRVIGVKDGDFDRILGKCYHLDNYFLTDTHDWETMALSEECERLLTIEVLGRTEKGVFIKVLNDLKNYSYLKLYNIKEVCDKGKGGISFRDFAIANIYDGENECSIDDCLKKVMTHHNNSRLSYFPKESDILSLKNNYPNPDLLQFTCGHDLIQGIVRRLIHLKGCSTEVGIKETSRLFRTSFTIDKFKCTQLYRDIALWASTNHTIIWAA